MLEFLKNYYVFMLILLILSYLVPKESYQKYIQFFIGIFVVVLLLKPVLELFAMDRPELIYEVFEPFNQRIQDIELEIEGENLYEHFFFEGEGE